MGRNKETMKRVLKFISPYKAKIIIMLLTALVTVGFTLYTPILIGNGVDNIVGPGNVNTAGLLKVLGALAVIVVGNAVSQWVMNLLTNQVTYSVVQDVRSQAFAHLQEVPVSYIDANQPGDILSRIVSDVSQFSDGLLMGFTQLFTGVLTIFGTIGFMLSISVKITVIVILLTPISLFVASFIAGRTFRMFQEQSEKRAEMTSIVEELVGNQKIVQAFSYEERANERFGKVNEELRVCGIKAIFFSSITNPSTRFVNGLVYTAVGIFGAFTVIKGGMTVGQLTSFLNYANQYTKPFNEISGVITELENALACAKRLFDFIDTPAQEPDAPDAWELEKADGRVSVESVSFSYRKEVPLLTDISIDVKPGQRIAIVGPTGCGKSTFIKTIAVNVILAQSIHTCTAKRMHLPHAKMITSMAVRDDILSGDSYFIKEIKYLKRILDALSEDELVICVIDEILRGTNTQERIAASKAIMEYLAHHNCIAIVASHDKELTELEKIGYDNYHFSEEFGEADIVFDYKLQKGPANSQNAIRLLSFTGFPETIIERAENIRSEYR